MKSGIELIAEERQEQITKHNRTIESDVLNNKDSQIQDAMIFLLLDQTQSDADQWYPLGWSEAFYHKTKSKDFDLIKRLKVIGAFAAAEIDRLQAIAALNENK